MPSEIQKRYASLLRGLELKQNAGPFTLVDEALPVVVLHEVFDNPYLVQHGYHPGVVAVNSILLSVAPSVEGFRAGPYYVKISFGWELAVAQFRIIDFRLGRAGATAEVLHRISYGAAGHTSGHHVVDFPKINIRDGDVLYVVNTSAQLAADVLQESVFVQQL